MASPGKGGKGGGSKGGSREAKGGGGGSFENRIDKMLNDKKNNGLLEISKVRDLLGKGMTREQFDNKLFDMQAQDKIYLQHGQKYFKPSTTMQERIKDSAKGLDDPIRGRLYYISRVP